MANGVEAVRSIKNDSASSPSTRASSVGVKVTVTRPRWMPSMASLKDEAGKVNSLDKGS